MTSIPRGGRAVRRPLRRLSGVLGLASLLACCCCTTAAARDAAADADYDAAAAGGRQEVAPMEEGPVVVPLRPTPPRSSRAYMKCYSTNPNATTTGGGGRGNKRGSFVVVDEKLQVSLDLVCLDEAVPELLPPQQQEGGRRKARRRRRPLWERYPRLGTEATHACQQEDDKGQGHEEDGGGPVVCWGSTGALLVEAALSRACESWSCGFSREQAWLQDDLADLCLFYMEPASQSDCLHAFQLWKHYSQDRMELRDSWVEWAVIDSNDFVTGKWYRELDDLDDRSTHQAMADGGVGLLEESVYYHDLGLDPTYGGYLEEGIRDLADRGVVLPTPEEVLYAGEPMPPPEPHQGAGGQQQQQGAAEGAGGWEGGDYYYPPSYWLDFNSTASPTA